MDPVWSDMKKVEQDMDDISCSTFYLHLFISVHFVHIDPVVVEAITANVCEVIDK